MTLCRKSLETAICCRKYKPDQTSAFVLRETHAVSTYCISFVQTNVSVHKGVFLPERSPETVDVF